MSNERVFIPPVKIEGVKIPRGNFRNFCGAEKTHPAKGVVNTKGNRNFVIFLDEDTANDLIQYGWAIRWLDPREENDLPQAYLKINLKYRDENDPQYDPSKQPKVWLVCGKKKTLLDAQTVGQLDGSDIINADIKFNPSVNKVTGKVSAYCNTLYVTIEEDDLDKKYDFDDEDLPFEE